MATFDQLSAEQRAIVELVLQRGKTYDELADMLGMPETRVRELARDALVELAPLSARGVEEDWRSQLADYVLGQQAGAEATATRGHLRRSEAARTWTRSLLDSLEQLYENGSLPAIPEGERGARKRSTQSGRSSPVASGFFGALGAMGGVVVAGALVLLLVAVLLWPIGVLTGGEDESGSGDQAAADTGAQGGAGGGEQAQSGDPAGIAIVAQQGDQKSVLVRASNLAPSGDREAYEVWLYNSRGDAKSLGGQVTDAQGQYQAIGALPADFADYRFIDVSREPLDDRTDHSGDSVLRGRIPELREANPGGNRAAVLGQTVLGPPAG